MLPFENIEREILTRRDSETSDKFGKSPEKRTIEELLDFGIVIIDKPKGPTSHQTSAYVKDVLHLKKAGHSGTLDPAVTGVLPVAIGRATRIVQLLLPAGKVYVALMHVHKDVPEEKLREVFEQFKGKITQLPPVKSAVKRRERERHIYDMDIIEIDGKDVLFSVSCQAGTYIRKLISDMGNKIGGAHMAELRRTQAGPFTEEKLVTLQDLTDAYHYYNEGNEKYLRTLILPMEEATQHLPKIWVMDSAVNSLVHGSTLKVPGIAKLHDGIEAGDMVAIMTLKDELISYGNAELSSKEMLGERGIAAKSQKVFLPEGVYPKSE